MCRKAQHRRLRALVALSVAAVVMTIRTDVGDASVTRKPQAARTQDRQQRREQMERRLLEATERLMRNGASFTELSVDRLSTEAGISRASFYIYFEDKGHLLRRLAGQVFADLAESADRWRSVACAHSSSLSRCGAC